MLGMAYQISLVAFGKVFKERFPMLLTGLKMYFLERGKALRMYFQSAEKSLTVLRTVF